MENMEKTASGKFKICPSCGMHNPPDLLECSACETDLTGVRITDAAAEKTDGGKTETEGQNKAEEQQEERVARLVRICECGTQNPPQARKCAACGEDISDILPTAVSGEASDPVCRLCSVTDDFSAVPDRPVTVIGREAFLRDYLADRPFVSRQHARLTAADGRVMLENLSTTNRTFINNVPVGDGPAELHEGDEIGLGGAVIRGQRQAGAAYFVFHMAEEETGE